MEFSGVVLLDWQHPTMGDADDVDGLSSLGLTDIFRVFSFTVITWFWLRRNQTLQSFSSSTMCSLRVCMSRFTLYKYNFDRCTYTRFNSIHFYLKIMQDVSPLFTNESASLQKKNKTESYTIIINHYTKNSKKCTMYMIWSFGICLAHIAAFTFW